MEGGGFCRGGSLVLWKNTWPCATIVYVMKTLPNITIELIPDPEYGGFTALIPGIEVVGEGETEQAAVDDLKVCLSGYIAEYGQEEMLTRLLPPVRILHMNFGELVHG